MASEVPLNRFYIPPPESELSEDRVRNLVKSEFVDACSGFLDRLACAKVFDPERFDAIMLWSKLLRRCYSLAGMSIPSYTFRHFPTIRQFLEQEATYSQDQKLECDRALVQWSGLMGELGLDNYDT